MSERTTSLTGTIGRDHYRTELRTGDFDLLADEPVQLGGTNAGPGPDQYLMASLAACKIITLRLYADRKEWPLERIELEMQMHVNDKVRPVETDIHCVFRFAGPLDEKQINRLLEIADKCPTHRLLSGEIRISSQL